jgi:hypothetical protein
MVSFADLEIRILGAQDEGYPVELTLNSEQEFGRGILRADFLPWVPSDSPAADGQRLFEVLFADEKLRSAWENIRGQQPERRLRIRIGADAPELHVIPWELLQDPADGQAQVLAASTATPFSRYLAGRWQPGGPIFRRPVTVLVAIANPENLSVDFGLEAVDIDQEWALLQEAVKNLDLTLVQLPQPCTLQAIETHLREGCHILHFVGHGAYSSRNERAVLYLSDENEQVKLVDQNALGDMLARQLGEASTSQEDKLRLVFLASCQTASRSPADAFRGLAPRLIAAGVPAVIAMQDPVPLETARSFASTFYQRLMAHGLVDLASNEARSTLMSANLPGAAIPVLFSRLRSNRLLGQRGRITSVQEDTFWPFLLENIDRGQCTPFLGPRVNAGLLPSRETLAEKLADKYGYPLADRHRLVRVAQYMDINDPDLLNQDYIRLLQRSLFGYLDIKPTIEQKRQFRDASFSETAEALNWRERVLAIQENEIHHLLADLELPLYVTTNFDNFMVEALKHNGRTPRRLGPRWSQPEAGTPHFVIDPEPSREDPVVFQLNGFDTEPEQFRHMVLSEDDFLAYFVRLRRDQESILPMNMLRILSENSFLFLGYDLGDWEFRVILQGLIKPIAQTNLAKKRHVGVQLEVDQAPSPEKAMEYLGRYLDQFDIDIYWGTPQQFVAELHASWLEYVEMEDDWSF